MSMFTMLLQDALTLDTITKHVKPALFFPCLIVAVAALIQWARRRQRRRVFLVDFACYKPPRSQSHTLAEVMNHARTFGKFSAAALDFMEKTLERSGLGDSTYLPESIFREPPNMTYEEALNESRAVMFGAVDELLAKTGVAAADIGILIVNCTIFAPMPSLSAMIVNRFKFRDTVLAYNLQGMGCTASLTAVGLAKHLLQVHENSYALIVSTENCTQNCYQGENRSMILINSLFRVGGAAILLSNRQSYRQSAKYELIHTVHTTTANSDRSYNCILRSEDCDGTVGVNINKDLLAMANETIEANITALSHLILPLSEKFIYVGNYLLRRLKVVDGKPYVPDFKKAITHIFPHVGAKPVLDSLQKSLDLTDGHMEASRMTLFRFGNTSSSSTWYEIAYSEAKGRMKRGDRLWQIAFGSGFKCSSAIWRVMRTIGPEERNPWSDEIDKFPVNLSNIKSFPYHFEPPTKK